MSLDLLASPAERWRCSGASAIGKSHVDMGLPNQDSLHVQASPSGRVMAAVVCDGAGTAPRSGEGSSLVAATVGRDLCDLFESLPGRTLKDAAAMNVFRAAVGRARNRLTQLEPDLRVFHTTMVAWVCTNRGSFVAQVGDSIALASRAVMVAGRDGIDRVDYFAPAEVHMFEAERGEYANETHFITEPDWEDHLRVHRVPDDADCIALMSDGAMDVAITQGQVFRGFLSNLVGKMLLTHDKAERDATVHDWLADRQTFAATSDDKTLFLALNLRLLARAGSPVLLEPPTARRPTTTHNPKHDRGHPGPRGGADASSAAAPPAAQDSPPQAALPLPPAQIAEHTPGMAMPRLHLRIYALLLAVALVACGLLAVWTRYSETLRPEPDSGHGTVQAPIYTPKVGPGPWTSAAGPLMPPTGANTGRAEPASAASALDSSAAAPMAPSEALQLTPSQGWTASAETRRISIALPSGATSRVEVRRVELPRGWRHAEVSTCREELWLAAGAMCQLVLQRAANPAPAETVVRLSYRIVMNSGMGERNETLIIGKLR